MRAPAVSSRVSFSWISRESLLLLNNVVFLVSTLTVLFGTLFPGGSGKLKLTAPDDLLNTGIEVEVRDDARFVCSHHEFASWAKGRKQLRMENFYREMRVRTGLLMDGDEPFRFIALTKGHLAIVDIADLTGLICWAFSGPMICLIWRTL